MMKVEEFVRLQEEANQRFLARFDVLAGRRLISHAPLPLNPKARCILPNALGGPPLCIDEAMFSKHMLIVGSIGTGKTNFINWLIMQIKQSLRPDELLVIFDTKGDFYDEFYTPGDVVISNDETACGRNGVDYWNIFNEMVYDQSPVTFANEIATRIFEKKIEKSSQPFFPNAARDVLMAILVYFYRLYQKTGKMPTNKDLRDFLDRANGQILLNMLGTYEDMQAIVSYISHPESPQTQGVISELQQGVRSVFIDNFAQNGTLSIREAVKNKGGYTLFVAYDIKYGAVLAPIYTLLIDLALKEALGRTRQRRGNLWVVIDEFRLLPKLSLLEFALNFGRSLGVKLIVAMQNINQVYEAYGEQLAQSILSGFTTVVTFGLTDANTRKFVADNSGKQIRMYSIGAKGFEEEQKQINEGNVVEDWLLASLRVGQSLITVPSYPIFLHQLPPYRSKEESWRLINEAKQAIAERHIDEGAPYPNLSPASQIASLSSRHSLNSDEKDRAIKPFF